MRYSGTMVLGGLVVAGTALATLTSHASVWAPAREGVARPVHLLGVVGVALLVGFLATAAVHRFRREGRLTLDSVVPPTVAISAAVALFGITFLPLYPPPPPTGLGQEADSGRIGVRLESDWVGPAIRRGGEGGGTEFSLVSQNHALFVRSLLVLLLIAGLLGLAAIVRSRRVEAPTPEPELPPFNAEARAAAHDAVLVTIDAMLADPDPRTAIIGAYARLLEELEATGAARREYEGPKEHLYRVLSVLAVRAAPLEMLIVLFEEARFSQHTLTGQHRDDALRALETVARELSSPVGQGSR